VYCSTLAQATEPILEAREMDPAASDLAANLGENEC
jgi:hypothetical protein